VGQLRPRRAQVSP